MKKWSRNISTNVAALMGFLALANYAECSTNTPYLSVNTNDTYKFFEIDPNSNKDGHAAKGESSIVLGLTSNITRNGSIVIGNNINDQTTSPWDGVFATLIGHNTYVQGTSKSRYLTMVGTSNSAMDADGSVSIGSFTKSNGYSNITIGNFVENNSSKGESIAIANNQINSGGTDVEGRKSFVLGPGNIGIGTGVQIGSHNTANTQGSQPEKAIGIGYNASVMKIKAIAIGNEAYASSVGGVALGYGSETRSDNQGEISQTGYNPAEVDPTNKEEAVWKSTSGYSEISVGKYIGGKTTISRRIANVAAGVHDADAVNVAQLKSVELKLLDDAKSPTKVNLNLKNDTLKVKGDANITTLLDSNDKSLSVSLKSDLTGITSITNMLDGTKLTLNNNGVSVNDRSITGLKGEAITSTSTAAVTGKQLFEAMQHANVNILSATGQTQYTTQDGTPLVRIDGVFYDKTKLEAKYTLANDGRYYAKNDVDQNGNLTNTAAQKVDLKNDADADKVENNQVITSLTNANGSTTTAQTLTNLASGISLANMKGEITSSTQLTDPIAARKAIAGENMDGTAGLYRKTTKDLHKGATVGDLQAVALSGLTFTADSTSIHRPLGTALNFMTGASLKTKEDSNYAYTNLATFVESTNNTIHFAMRKTPTFESIILKGANDTEGTTLLMKDGKLALKQGNNDAQVLGFNLKSGATTSFVPLNGTIEFTAPNAPPEISIALSSTPSKPLSVDNIPPTHHTVSAGNSATANTTVNDGAKLTFGLPTNAEVVMDTTKLTDNSIINKGYLDRELETIRTTQQNGNTDVRVHMASMNKQIGALDHRISRVSDNANAGVAAAMATANIPQVTQGKERNAFGVGLASYRNGNAIALGFSGTNKDRNVIWKLSGSYDSSHNLGVGVGIGFTFGEINQYPSKQIATHNVYTDVLSHQELNILKTKNEMQSKELKRQAEEINQLKAQVQMLLKAIKTH